MLFNRPVRPDPVPAPAVRRLPGPPPCSPPDLPVFTILEYIRHQAALGFLSEEFAQDEKNLVAIPVNQIATGHVNFVWNRDPNQFPALKRFLAFVEERYGKKELLPA